MAVLAERTSDETAQRSMDRLMPLSRNAARKMSSNKSAAARDESLPRISTERTGAVYADRRYDAMALPGTVLRGGDLGSRI
jgi:hypothetical protein